MEQKNSPSWSEADAPGKKQGYSAVLQQLLDKLPASFQHSSVSTSSVNGRQSVDDPNTQSNIGFKYTTGGATTYACKVCLKSFSQRNALAEHMSIHSGKKPHVCEVCNKAFTQATQLKIHKMVHNDTGQKPHVCDVCNRPFTSAFCLKRHYVTHTRQSPHTCDVCDEVLASAVLLSRHKLIHTDQKPYVCDVCNKVFTQHGALNQHKLLHTDQRPHACNVCNKAFTQASDLKQHKMVHRDQKYICGVCGKVFNWVRNLKHHKLKQHQMTYTERSPVANDALSDHLNSTSIHHTDDGSDNLGDDGVTVKIEMEEETENDKHQDENNATQFLLHPHRMTIQHFQDTNLQNTNSDKMFQRTQVDIKTEVTDELSLPPAQEVWIKTERTVDIVETPAVGIAEICMKPVIKLERDSFTFNSLGEFEGNKRTEQLAPSGMNFESEVKVEKDREIRPATVQFEVSRSERQEVEDVNLEDPQSTHKPFHTGKKFHTCDVCNKVFATICNLKQHKLTHKGQKPYVCNVCSKTFRFANGLKLHYKIHTGQSPYTCDACNKVFSRAFNLRCHKCVTKRLLGQKT